MSIATEPFEKASRVQTGGKRDCATASAGSARRTVTRVGADLQLTAKSLAFAEIREEHTQSDGTIRFCFRLSGDSVLKPDKATSIRINRPTLLVYRGPHGDSLIERHAAGTEQRSVEISIRRPFLLNGLLGSTAELPARLSPLLQPCVNFVSIQIPLTAQLYQLATRVESRPMAGPLGAAYTEAITVELLRLALSELGSSGTRPMAQASLNERNVQRLHAARALITKNLTSPATIRQLARAAAMNETSLKRGFKALFGETVGQFSLRVRMEHALTLLQEQHMSVSRVADSVGYRHRSSFTAAFRRHFGMCPKSSRNRARRAAGGAGAAQSR